MAKKKKTGKRSSSKSPKLPGPGERARTFDGVFRAMADKEFSSNEEAREYANRLLQGEIELPEKTPLQKAQDLIYDAWDEKDPKRRLELAREALHVSPDCADAYAILADEAETMDQIRSLLEKGIEAAKQALGPKPFKEDVGHFWGIFSTRPYMRVRAALTECLWAMGAQDLAITHLKDMLRLNPNDNQGLRYVLAGYLAETGDDAGLAKLLCRYDESTAGLEYARALLQFRNWGKSDQARDALHAAFESNRYVPDYLLRMKRIPGELPDGITPGGKDEAVEVCEHLDEAWRKTNGALDWLRKTWQE